jgi:hypothetical protein
MAISKQDIKEMVFMESLKNARIPKGPLGAKRVAKLLAKAEATATVAAAALVKDSK